MREDSAAWRRRAASIARRSARRLQQELEAESDPERKRRLARRILHLTEIADNLDSIPST
jgi:hypothetical protein